jgi:hypothetical protein
MIYQGPRGRMKTTMGTMAVSQYVIMSLVFFSQVLGEKIGLAWIKVFLLIDCPGLKYDAILFGQETMQLMKLKID